MKKNLRFSSSAVPLN